MTISDYNQHTNEILHAEIKEKELDDKSDISGFIYYSDLDKKNNNPILATKAELKAEQGKILKLQALNLIFFT